MESGHDKEPTFVAAAITETPRDEGGYVLDGIVATDGNFETAAREVGNALGIDPEALAGAVRTERQRRSRTQVGYTGRWATDWDPHADQHGTDSQIPRGADGEITYQ